MRGTKFKDSITPEKRIYVVVANKVDISPNLAIEQPMGRQVAQACHAVSVVRHKIDHGKKAKEFKAITTIVLAARDSQELNHIANLMEKEEIPFEVFYDDNTEAYGPEVKVFTALASHPVEPIDLRGITDYLPLWGSDRHFGKR